MSIERKTLKESILATILFLVTVLSSLSGFLPSEGGYLSVLAVGGYMLASLLHAKRCLDAPSRAFLRKVYLILAVVSFIATIVGSLINSVFSFLVILDSIGGVLSIVLLVMLSEKFDFIENCTDKAFYIILAVCLLVMPSILLMISGLITAIIGIVLTLVCVFFIFKFGLPAIMDSINQVPKAVFYDKKGFAHKTEYQRDESNKDYDRKRENNS